MQAPSVAKSPCPPERAGTEDSDGLHVDDHRAAGPVPERGQPRPLRTSAVPSLGARRARCCRSRAAAHVVLRRFPPPLTPGSAADRCGRRPRADAPARAWKAPRCPSRSHRQRRPRPAPAAAVVPRCRRTRTVPPSTRTPALRARPSGGGLPRRDRTARSRRVGRAGPDPPPSPLPPLRRGTTRPAHQTRLRATSSCRVVELSGAAGPRIRATPSCPSIVVDARGTSTAA